MSPSPPSPHPPVERLSAYLDGDLEPPGRTEIERHLSDCVACRHTLDELRDLVDRAGALAAGADRPPERDLWPEIERRLGSGPSARHRPPAERPGVRLAVRLAAAAALIAAVAGAVYFAVSRPAPEIPPEVASTDATDATDAEAAAELQAVLRRSPILATVAGPRLAEEQRTFDRALAETRSALAVDPDNPYLREHLRRLRGQRQHLVRRVSAAAPPRGDRGGPTG
jgi:hypothetical protein